MKSTKPYLIRAIHEWCADQGFTPYLAVSADATTRVPREFVKDGEIVLNVGLEATHQLLMGNEEITFQARFGGRSFPVVVPVERVAAIYARENGEGMAFEVTERLPADEAADPSPTAVPVETAADVATPAKPGRPVLTRVK
ncbi:MAG: ClpXP protease specificity-enhancing factor [Betaproteobacteria bacterium]|nr:ClpXP protease specificity-enhancing factor [Rhodocyclales bacterium]